MEASNRELHGAARAGLWIGAFGWLIGLTAVTLPETLALAGPMVGGAAVTAACALAVEALLRHAPRPQLAVCGGSWLAVGVISAYYAWIVEPSVRAVPGLVERLHGFGVSVELPMPFAVVALAVGAPLLLASLHCRETPVGD